jgi:hypothetical protein
LEQNNRPPYYWGAVSVQRRQGDPAFFALAGCGKITPNSQAGMVREGMRGADQQQNHIFNYVSPEERVRKDHPLRTITQKSIGQRSFRLVAVGLNTAFL